MAMRGGLVSHKGNGNGQTQRGRSYGLMLILAFGASLLAVMALHKLRERRIFNLLVEEKNRQLVSFKLLLQKEKEYTKEMKRKAEEAKAKIFSLRNQKMELDRRVFEMQSTIDSLKDERKSMESQLEEKQRQTNPVIALSAALKQKEAEIEELKHCLLQSSSVRVWSVSNDDLTRPVQRDKTEINLEPSFSRKENKSEGVKDGSEEKSNIAHATYRNGGENAGNEGATTATEMNKEYSENTTDTMKNADEQEKLKNRHEELLGESHLSRSKGKRWRALARNRFLKKNINFKTEGGETVSSSRRFSKENDDVSSSRKEKDQAKANLFKHHNPEDMKPIRMSETNHQAKGENAMPKDHDNSFTRVIKKNTGVDGEASNYPQNEKQLKEEAVASSRGAEELEKKVELISHTEDENEMEVADKQEPETEAANDDLSSDFMSDLEDKKAYKEETEETEF